MRSSRTKATRTLELLLLCVAIAAVAAGCGGGSTSDGDSDSPSTSTSSTTASNGGVSGKRFETFRIITTGIDSLDPALSQTIAGGGLAAHAYLPLVSYRRVNGTDSHELIPALAESVPKPSSDGLTYVFRLRDVSFANGKPVRPSDVKATIERLFKIRSPFVSNLSVIEGADAFAKSLKGGISGIAADDAAGTVTFTLTQPSGLFLNIMAGPGILPADTPARDISTSPPPPTGPLEIVSYQPNSSYVLRKNERYEPIDGIPASNVDRVEGTIVTDAGVALQRTIEGKADYNQVPIPPERLSELQSQHGDQLKLYNLPSTHMFFLNQSKAPFNKLEARQAVNHAIDRDAMVKLAGGLGTATQNILPPSYTSFDKLDTYSYDLDKAKELIKQAGLEGAPVRVIGSAAETSRPFVTYLADQLRKIGLRPELKIFSPSVYFGVGGTESTNADTGWDPWNEDIPHPNDWFGPLFDGSGLKPAGNTNWGRVDIPDVNRQIEKLSQPPLSESADGYAALDRQLVEQEAAIAPYMNPAMADFFGPGVDTSCYVQLAQYRLDITQVCAR